MQPVHTIPGSPLRIVLVGFMGAGKSTTGPILAARLGWQFEDADHYLEKITGCTIATLFNNSGEPEFRRMEAEAIDLLHQKEELVLAVGGGAIESESTRRLLAESAETCVVFLKAPLDILIARCEEQPDAAIRPVLNQRELLRERFDSRQRHYEAAHITVETEGLSPSAVADLIYQKLQESFFVLPLTLKAATI